MRWRNGTARLEAYCDSWSMLSTMADVLAALAATDKNYASGITPEQFRTLLRRHGFTDTTQRTAPKG